KGRKKRKSTRPGPGGAPKQLSFECEITLEKYHPFITTKKKMINMLSQVLRNGK
uniref:Uncharacterized protein n=1 Tax=Canis lupus familiaris TaxID=9615 RepID=A0A8I3MAL8_CANLF